MVNRKQGHGQTELTKPWQEHLSSSWVFIKVKNRTDSKCRAEFRKNQGLDKLKVLKDKWLSWALLHQAVKPDTGIILVPDSHHSSERQMLCPCRPRRWWAEVSTG